MQQEPFLPLPAEILTRNEEVEQLRLNTPLPTDENTWQTEIIQRCLTGDETAFSFIAEHYGNLLLRTAYLLVRDEELAKDIVQEALFQAWKNLQQLREPTFLRAWLLKIVINQAMSFKRQLLRKTAQLREQIAYYALDLSIRQSEDERGSLEDKIDLAQALLRLPDKQRIVLILFYYQHMSIPEIASCLNVPENTLRKRLQAGLDKMRRALYLDHANEQTHNSQATPVPTTRMHVRRGGIL